MAHDMNTPALSGTTTTPAPAPAPARVLFLDENPYPGHPGYVEAAPRPSTRRERPHERPRNHQ